MRSILVVCMGNICRSPVGERLLARALGDGVLVSSAGLQALAGQPADGVAAAIAGEHGLALDGHVARQYTAAIGLDHDLILVMELAFRKVVVAEEPALLGRTMLYGQWNGAPEIPDPYRRSRAFHEHVFRKIAEATSAWASRLNPKY
jgi:protein-tyrosine phosphatase